MNQETEVAKRKLRVENLKIGQRIVDPDGIIVEVESISPGGDKVTTYNSAIGTRMEYPGYWFNLLRFRPFEQ